MNFSKKKILIAILFATLAAGFLAFVPIHTFAQTDNTITTNDLGLSYGAETGLASTDIRLVIARIIRVALGLLGIVALVLILYGGYVWMTAGGNEENIQKAKKILMNAAIGLIIILCAYAIASFVINALSKATGYEGGGGEGGGGGGGAFANALYITSMPGSDLGCGIRNIHPVIVFNRPVDLATVASNLVVRSKVDAAAASGEWHYAAFNRQNAVVFDPVGDCGVAGHNDCLAASTTYQIFFTNAANIKSQNGLSLTCIGNYKNSCLNNPAVEFTTGVGVDTEPPTVSIVSPSNGQSFAQGASVPVEISYTDNFGLQNLGLLVDGVEVNTLAISGCKKSGSATINWSTGSSATGTYSVTALATDNANLIASDSRNISLIPAHCFDNVLNNGETEAGPPACGDGCGACGGASCTENSDCASGWCEDGVCVDRMMIESFTPTAGAASSTYVTISGRYFGDDGGHVYFKKATGDWTEAFVVNCGAGIDNWTSTQLVVKVPKDAATGPIRVITATTTGSDGVARQFIDTTDNDGWGYNKDFTVNSEILPGLCALKPNSGQPFDYTVLVGENFGSDEDTVLFGSSTSYIKSWATQSITARVPGLGSGPVAVKVVRGGKSSNALRYTVRESLNTDTPLIESISPNHGAKGEYITITGKNFGNYQGEVWFKLNGEGEAKLGSFDFPDECAGATWGDTQIIVKFPSGGVVAGQSYSVQVRRSIDAAVSPIAGINFDLESGNPSPGICTIDPSSGPIPLADSSTMKIYGEYYQKDGSASTPYYWRSSASATSTSGRVAADEVVNETDESAEVYPALNSETGPVVMHRASDGKIGNSLPFTVYDCIKNGNKCSASGYKCCTKGADAGVCKLNGDLCAGETRSTGYIWRFNTGPFPPSARVMERCNAATDRGDNLPSPSPSIQWTSGGDTDQYNVCRTALVNIEFTMKMLASTINSDNIKIYKCNEMPATSSINYTENTCEHGSTAIDMQPSSYSLFTAEGDGTGSNDYISMSPTGDNWSDDTYYQVVLTDNIKAASTSYYYGDEIRYINEQNLKTTRPCGDGTAYCFIFRTDDQDCKLSKVIVTPYKYWTAILEAPMRYRTLKANADDAGTTLYYRGSGLSDQHCVMMSMKDFVWSWASADTIYADTYGASTGTRNNLTQVSAKANTVAVGLTDPDNAVNILGTASSTKDSTVKTGASPLTIDLSDPKVVDYWPNCLEACTNAEVGARFNILMSDYNLDNSSVSVNICNDENCNSLTPVAIEPKLSESDSRTIIVSLDDLSAELATNTIYQVALSHTGTTTADQAGQLWSGASSTDPNLYSRPMQTQFVWRFKTKADKCVVENVNILPSLYNAIYIHDRKVYSAEARSAPDECDASGQKLNAWSVNWNWESSSTSVATVQEFSTKGYNPACSASCVKKGSDAAYGAALTPLCGNGRVEAGEDCDPPASTSPNGLSCTLNCLRPGNVSSTTCGNSTVENNLGEECEPTVAGESAGCTAKCLHTGSNASTGAEEIGASICGNGTVGTGEECDLGIESNYLDVSSAMNCSANCLHGGTSLSANWCANNTTTFGGFNQSDYVKVCQTAVSQCGDGVVSPGEDPECETMDTSDPVNDGCADNCLADALSLKKCEPTYNTTEFIYGSAVTAIKNTEGCNELGQYGGSSLSYSDPSVCGDGIVGIGEDPACESGYVISHTYTDPWTLAIGVGAGAPTGEPPAQITDIKGTGQQTVGAKTYTDSGKGQYKILCGYKTDKDCQEAMNDESYGVGENSCCYNMAELISTYPEKSDEPVYDICPNTYIEAKFDRVIDADTLANGIFVAKGYAEGTTCPTGEVDVSNLYYNKSPMLADDGRGIFSRIAKAWHYLTKWLKNIFSSVASAARTDYLSDDNEVFCAISDYGVSAVSTDYAMGKYSTSTVRVNLTNALDTNSDYAIILSRDVRDKLGVSIGNSVRWRFITGDEICTISNVAIDPSEYMFTVAGSSTEFIASTTAENGQMIQPVFGYSWEYEWGPVENDVISLTDTTSSMNLVTAKNHNGEVTLTATTKLTQNIIDAPDASFTGNADIAVFLCENPWPSASPSSFPFYDEDYDFSTYYCRDYGSPGTADDLPYVTTTYFDASIVSSNYAKRYIFTNTDNKDAIGMQIFYNPKYMSIADWYANEGFSGGVGSLKVDGYDALGNSYNYYVDALKTKTETSNTIYPNIYQFSLNNDATPETTEVFKQMINNLKFNNLVRNEAYCADDTDGADINYSMHCTNDLDCRAFADAAGKVGSAAYANNLVCMNLRDKLQRDYTRLKDLRTIISKFTYGGGLVGAWSMDAINYGKVTDDSGHGLDAVAYGTGVSVATGTINNAIHIYQKYPASGDYSYLQLSGATSVGDRSFTVGLWVKTTTTLQQGAFISNIGTGSNGFSVGLSSSMGGLYAQIGDSSSFTRTGCTSVNVADGSWHHVVVVYNRNVPDSSGYYQMLFYVDGNLICTNQMPSVYPGMAESATNPVRISYPAILNKTYVADYDNARIYARALSADEISDWYTNNLPVENSAYPKMAESTYITGQALSVWQSAWGALGAAAGTSLPTDPINKLAQAGTCYLPNSAGGYNACYKDSDCATISTANRESYWTADDGTAVDEGSLLNNGSFVGAVGVDIGKGHGKAFSFAGDASAYVLLPHNSAYNSNQFTVSAWIYPTKKNTATIIKKGGSDENGNSLGGFILEYSGLQYDSSAQMHFNNGTIRFAVFPTSTSEYKYFTLDSDSPITVNAWHHIVATFDKTVGTGALYIDGVLASITFRTPTGAVASIGNVKTAEFNELNMEAGASFNGLIDNIAFYSRSVDATEASSMRRALCVLHDATTGWSAEDRRFSFACNTSSYAYRYTYVSSTDSFWLRANLERYASVMPGNWISFVKSYVGGWTNIKSYAGGWANFTYGICAADDEIASPYHVSCGDGVLGGTEECDPPGKTVYDTSACPLASSTIKICNNQCKWSLTSNISCRSAAGGSCGDGKIQTLAGETCDDGALNGTNGRCNTTCNGTVELCGNGNLDSGEFCDTVTSTGMCTFRDGAYYEVDPYAAPIYYFIIDLTKTMTDNKLSDGLTTRLGKVTSSLPYIAVKFNHGDTKAKIGIGTFSRPPLPAYSITTVNTNHDKDWMDGSIGYFTAAEVNIAVNNSAFQPQYGGQNTDDTFDWFKNTILENWSASDKKHPINIIYVTDGDGAVWCGTSTVTGSYVPNTNGTRCGAIYPDQKIIDLYDDYGVITNVVGVGDFGASSESGVTKVQIYKRLASKGHGQYFQLDSSDDSMVDMMLSIYKKPCSEYSRWSGYSCAWNCKGFGGYCGDGVIQSANGEECETDQASVVGGKSGVRKCVGCQLEDWEESAAASSGACGNGTVDEDEACDRGSKNGFACTPVYPQKSCTYCSSDCKSIITVDLKCGNGVLDEGETCDFANEYEGYRRAWLPFLFTWRDSCYHCNNDCDGWDVAEYFNNAGGACDAHVGYCGNGIIEKWPKVYSASTTVDWEECDGSDVSNCPTCMGQKKVCTSDCTCSCEPYLSF